MQQASQEAQIQAETGKALVADADSDMPMEEVIEEIVAEAEEEQLEGVLEDSALEIPFWIHFNPANGSNMSYHSNA